MSEESAKTQKGPVKGSAQGKSKNSDAKVILYLGEDEGFWQDLKEGFSSFKQINFEFNLLYEKDPQKIQNFVKTIYDERPRVVFIDLAKNTDEMLHLLRVQNRIHSPTKPFVIALTAYKQGEEVKRQAIMAGAKCVHVKSGETDAVVYDAICFAFHNALEHHGFATAKMSDEVSAFFPAKASVLSPKGIRVESNYKATKGELYLLHTHWSRNAITKSALARLSAQDSKDLFSNFEYAQELGFEFPPFEAPEEASEQEIAQLKEKREEESRVSGESLRAWIEAAKPNSKAKTLKTLVIDKDLNLYTDQPPTDSYNFVVRAQPYLVKFKKELTRIMPHMIAYNMEEVDPEELEANQDLAHMFNEGNNLRYLIKVVKSIGDFDPFVVVFNTEHDTKKLQKVLSYPQVIGYKESISPDLIVKMADMLQNRLFGKEDPFGPDIVVLDKKLESSYAEFETSISVTACSENDIYFNSDEEFETGAVFRVNTPANMYVTIAEPPKNPKSDGRYYGLIHGIGEEEKKDLRRYINSVFFREKEAAKQKEREEFEQAKEKYLEQNDTEGKDKDEESA